eukprot:GILJ01005811.1.p1 GENE.GILJ01005811.1~~GILJ01005811.1.p1  ORF type:complete len:551 (-),score=61.92 GILJ01005811.1:82-1734(-)
MFRACCLWLVFFFCVCVVNGESAATRKAVSAPVLIHASYETREIGIFREHAIGRQPRTSSFSGYIVRVLFDRDLYVRRLFKDGTSNVTELSLATSEQLHGLTRLVCYTRLVESYPNGDNGLAANNETVKVPFYFVPFGVSDSSLPAVAKMFKLISSSTVKQSLGSRMYSGFLLSTMRNASTVSIQLDPGLISQCEIRFLEPNEQTFRPPAVLEDRNGSIFTGRVKLDMFQMSVFDNTTSADTYNNSTSPRNTSTDSAIPSAAALRTFQRDLFGLVTAIAPVRKFVCKPSSGKSKEKKGYAAVFAEMESKTLNIAGMLTGIIGPIIEPVADMMGDIMGDTVTEVIGQVLGQSVALGCTDLISGMLTHDLTTSLIVNLVPSLTETISDSVTESLAESMREYLTNTLTRILTSRLTKSLDESLSKSVTKKVNVDTPARLARKLTHNLGHILTRSLTHSVVPALSHTLLHSPSQDYYCYYCYRYRIYCKLCQYSPSQVYYAMYYSGYYSQYYANFYSDFFSRKMTERDVRTIAKKAEFKDIMLMKERNVTIDEL